MLDVDIQTSGISQMMIEISCWNLDDLSHILHDGNGISIVIDGDAHGGKNLVMLKLFVTTKHYSWQHW